jgi:fructose-bisphosphate aldolase class II
MKGVQSMDGMLRDAHANGYAVGAFSARYSKMIKPIIEAAVLTASPVIVQLSEKEIIRHQVSLQAFAAEFYRVVAALDPPIPVALHLDHTKTLSVIEEAIDAGFTSVMIDASEHEFERNIEITSHVVKIAHGRNVAVEAELGRIGTTDKVETDEDVTRLTDPHQALEFILKTGIDALAVSVGTSHGLYVSTRPRIVYSIIEEINRGSTIPLVLHGGSGVPAAMLEHAVRLPGGGISKVNIATELEMAMLASLGRNGHMTEADLNALNQQDIQTARTAVLHLVVDKIEHYTFSARTV